MGCWVRSVPCEGLAKFNAQRRKGRWRPLRGEERREGLALDPEAGSDDPRILPGNSYLLLVLYIDAPPPLPPHPPRTRTHTLPAAFPKRSAQYGRAEPPESVGVPGTNSQKVSSIVALYCKHTWSLTFENLCQATEPSGEDGEGDPTAMVEINIILQVSLTLLFVNIGSLLKLDIWSLLMLEDVYY
jgi:hypothetical protein